MRYLCAKHCEVVQHNREQANRLWRGAYENGVAAYERGDWQRAEPFLGTAYEIALVRFALDVQQCQCCFNASQLAAVGRYYANVLCRLDQPEHAEVCLRRVHDGLLHWSQETRLPYQERLTAYEQVPEFREKRVALLRLTGKSMQAKCADLLARQMAKQAGATLYH